MASLDGELWRHNVTHVVVVDCSDDYRPGALPMPADCYPILCEKLLPAYAVRQDPVGSGEMRGFLYDWHESGGEEEEPTFVGLVRAETRPGEG